MCTKTSGSVAPSLDRDVSLQLSDTSMLKASLWSHLVVLVHYSLSSENCIDENLPAA